MNFLENIRIALRGLRSNKLRSVLTMLGIIIGVGAVIIMVSIGQGAKASVAGQIQGLGSNLLIVTPGQSNTAGVKGGMGSLNNMTMDDVNAIKSSADAVASVAPTTSKQAQVVYGSENTSTQVVGTTPSYADVRNQQASIGRFFTDQENQDNAQVAVIGTTVVQDLTGNPNTNMVGQTININQVPFQVIGILQSKGSSGASNNDDQIVVPISSAETRLIGSDSIRTIYVEAKSSDLMDTASGEITQILRQQHGLSFNATNDFTVTSQTDILSTAEGVSQSLTLLLSGVAAISLLVGGIGIMNIMLVSVTERTREIGIRKAIGAKRKTIMLQFLIEAVIISMLGGVLGILFGSGGSSLLNKFAGITTQISTSPIIMAFAFSFAIGIIFGVFPARKAAKLHPIDALRYE
ncbi:macrolide export ATP-binding/permease protein MacB [Desulfosporosinus acididurans]|uniref:Macrolide export ATP-binding/permease protein MacB n=1 Tax=Desulfosporosinus acididurans TaxID=476652 RepID=A0A0J1FQS1_9FIRM|nr:ABC transporter permease [Desulfosporosinus acididurans]KLU65854.1 macrolide export ATP-binding/permease protein MacB [Desulfosporosinus acididurans]